MKMTVEEMNKVINRAKFLRSMVLNDYAACEREGDQTISDEERQLISTLKNGSARWWYNLTLDTLSVQTNEHLMDYPKSESMYGYRINHDWVPVFNTNSGFLLR